MKRIIKNSYLLILLFLCTNLILGQNNNDNNNEKIKSVYNDSTLGRKFDNTVDKEKLKIYDFEITSNIEEENNIKLNESLIMNSINLKLGIRYKWGSEGPNAYDCSGFIWKVFNESNIKFTRARARDYWFKFKPVFGEDRFRFGTLVFFNKLKHVGIVVDKNGFYHASSSRGIIYSKFNNYWKKRIVGFRKIK